MNEQEMLRALMGMSEPDEAELRRERDKARQLRKTRWWQQKTASGECWYCGLSKRDMVGQGGETPETPLVVWPYKK